MGYSPWGGKESETTWGLNNNGVYMGRHESGLVAVTPLTCISALWGWILCLFLPPQVRLWGWLQQLAARWQASCLYLKFPQGSPLGQL